MLSHLLSLAILACASEIQVETESDSVVYVATDFDPKDPDSLHLSFDCKGAVSLQGSVMNDLCGAHCMGFLESGFVTEADFYSQCMLDGRLKALLSMAESGEPSDASLFNTPSTCFTAGMPLMAEGPYKLVDVTYPGRCQQVCQEEQGCVYSVVVYDSSPMLKCHLFSQKHALEALIHVDSKEKCESNAGARWSECSFGSGFCSISAEVAINKVLDDGSLLLAAPAHCYAAASEPADNACISLDLAIRAARSGNVIEGADGKDYAGSGPEFHSGEGLEDVHFRGIDRILGFGRLYDVTAWKNMFGADEFVKAFPSDHVPPESFSIDLDDFE